MNATSREFFVYRLFDATDRLLYVGCTNSLKRRWYEHRSQHGAMATAAARCRVQGPYPHPTARSIERRALDSENPVYGLTPAKQSAIHRAYAWTDRRIRELINVGWPADLACKQAELDVKRQFPGQPTSYGDIWTVPA